MLNFTGAYEGNEKYICICCSDQDKNSVNPVISKLINDGYRVWFAEDSIPEYEKADVKIYLPRLEIKNKISDLREIFKKYHIEKVFAPANQDFDKLSSEPHTLKNMVHVVDLRLDETGSEALPVPEDDEDETC